LKKYVEEKFDSSSNGLKRKLENQDDKENVKKRKIE